MQLSYQDEEEPIESLYNTPEDLDQIARDISELREREMEEREEREREERERHERAIEDRLRLGGYLHNYNAYIQQEHAYLAEAPGPHPLLPRSRLNEAIHQHNLERVRELLEGGESPDGVLSLPGAPTIQLPLCAAASVGNLDIIRLLLEKGARITRTDSSGMTALYAAATRGNTEIALFLMRENSYLFDQSELDGLTPTTAALRNGYDDTACAISGLSKEPVLWKVWNSSKDLEEKEQREQRRKKEKNVKREEEREEMEAHLRGREGENEKEKKRKKNFSMIGWLSREIIVSVSELLTKLPFLAEHPPRRPQHRRTASQSTTTTTSTTRLSMFLSFSQDVLQSSMCSSLWDSAIDVTSNGNLGLPSIPLQFSYEETFLTIQQRRERLLELLKPDTYSRIVQNAIAMKGKQTSKAEKSTKIPFKSSLKSTKPKPTSKASPTLSKKPSVTFVSPSLNSTSPQFGSLSDSSLSLTKTVDILSLLDPLANTENLEEEEDISGLNVSHHPEASNSSLFLFNIPDPSVLEQSGTSSSSSSLLESTDPPLSDPIYDSGSLLNSTLNLNRTYFDGDSPLIHSGHQILFNNNNNNQVSTRLNLSHLHLFLRTLSRIH